MLSEESVKVQPGFIPSLVSVHSGFSQDSVMVWPGFSQGSNGFNDGLVRVP